MHRGNRRSPEKRRLIPFPEDTKRAGAGLYEEIVNLTVSEGRPRLTGWLRLGFVLIALKNTRAFPTLTREGDHSHRKFFILRISQQGTRDRDTEVSKIWSKPSPLVTHAEKTGKAAKSRHDLP